MQSVLAANGQIGYGLGQTWRVSAPAPVVDTGTYDLARQEEYANNSGTSLAITLRQTPVEGNLLVCFFGGKLSDANLTGPGAGWTKAVSRGLSTSLAVGIWYKIAASDSATITCTQAGGSAALSLLVREYEGVSASPLDVTVSNTGNSITSLNLGTTGTTAQADELALAVAFTGDAPPMRFTGWSDGFDEVMSLELKGPKMHVGEKLLSATGTVTVTPSWETSRNACGVIATFKLSAAPTRPAMPVRRLASGTYTTTENSGTTRATRSFTPSANRLIVCMIGESDDGGISAPLSIAASHGGALSWTISRNDLGGSVSRRVHLAYAWSASDPGADTLTFTLGQTGTALWYSIVEIGGVDLTDPIAQSADGDVGGGGATSITITQAGAPAADSTMLGIVLHGAVERHVHDAGYHLIQEGACADNGQQVSAFWYPAGDQATTISWATTIHAIAIVAEIRAA